MAPLRAKLALTGAMGIAVVAAMVWSVGGARLAELALHASPGPFAWALVMVAVPISLSVLRWLVLMGGLGYRIYGRDAFCQVCGSFLVSALTPGRAGEVFKLYVAKRLSGVEAAHSGAALLIERACDLSVMAGLILLGLVSGLGPRLGQYAAAAQAAAAFAVALVAALALSVRHRAALSLVARSLSLGGRLGLPGCARGAERVESCLPSFLSVAERTNVAAVLAITIGLWCADVARIWFVFRSLGADVPPLVIGFVCCTSLLLGVLSYLPGGLGVTELSMAGLFALLGVGADVATAAVLAERVLSFWLALLVGAAALSMRADELGWGVGAGGPGSLDEG